MIFIIFLGLFCVNKMYKNIFFGVNAFRTFGNSWLSILCFCVSFVYEVLMLCLFIFLFGVMMYGGLNMSILYLLVLVSVLVCGLSKSLSVVAYFVLFILCVLYVV